MKPGNVQFITSRFFLDGLLMRKGLIITVARIHFRRFSLFSAFAVAFTLGPSLLAAPVAPNTSAELAPADAWATAAPTSVIQDAPLSAADDIQNAPRPAISENKSAESAGIAKSSEEEEAEQKHDESQPPARQSPGDDLLPGLVSPEKDDRLSEIFPLVRAAEIEVRFAVAETGNVHAFDRAAELLSKASQKLQEIGTFQDKEADEGRSRLSSIVERLQHEVSELRQDARQTLAGRFPLIREFNLQLADEENEVHAYQSASVARRKAIFDALSKISKTAPSDAVLVGVWVSNHRQARPDSEMAALVNSQSRIAFGNLSNVTMIPGGLSQKLDALPSWDAPDSEFEPVCRQLMKTLTSTDSKGLMLVLLREFASDTQDGYWVQAQQRTYSATALKDAEDDPDSFEADKIRFAESFTRNRGNLEAIRYCGIGLLGVMALAAYGFWAARFTSPVPSWTNRLAIPGVGFAIGVILAPLVVLAMSNGMPEARSSIISSLWWPCVTGALTLILPSGVMRLALGTLGRYVPALSCHGIWGVSFIPVAAGVAAGWVSPAINVLGWAAAPFILAMTAAGVLLLYCFGRATDMADDFPLAFAPVVFVLSLPFGAGAFLGSSFVMTVISAAIALTLMLRYGRAKHWQWVARPESAPDKSPSALRQRSTRPPRTLDELNLALQSPHYQPADEYETFRKATESVTAGKTVWLGLVGPSAAGKSAAAEFLIGELQLRRPDLRSLVGHCTEKSLAYQPFREALAEIGVPQHMLTSHSQSGGMNDLFDRLADRFIPFWEFFSGYRDRVEENDDDDAAASVELLAAVTKALSGTAQAGGAVLLIDDVQWIDDWSAQMLEHLREQFPPAGEAPFLVILASREEQSLERFELGDDVVQLSPPDVRRQKLILEKSLGIAAASAKRIVEAMGALGQESGGMFWLLRSLRELIDRHALTRTSRGFTLKRQYLRGEHLPIPESMREELIKQFRASKEHRAVLECAALLGEKFRVSDLAECLRIERLTLLQRLRSLEEDEQMVHDLPADPDCYSFSSPFMWRIIRDELFVKGGNAGESRPTKIAREWHARIAAVLERRSPRTPPLIHDLALHYSSAGRGFERQAVDWCLAAAGLAMQNQRREEAIDWLRWAEQAARAGKIMIDPESKERFAELWNRPPRDLPDSEHSHESAEERTMHDLMATTSQC